MIGVLALQGNFAEHGTVLTSLGVLWKPVRTTEDLSACDALILPGGESTVMMKLLRASGLDEEIVRAVRGGMPVLGTCAGAILLSRSHLGLMDIVVERNAYGRQRESFVADIAADAGKTIHVSFIRAPRITRVGRDVRVMLSYDGHPILVEEKNMFAATFHTETHGDPYLHRLLIEKTPQSAG